MKKCGPKTVKKTTCRVDLLVLYYGFFRSNVSAKLMFFCCNHDYRLQIKCYLILSNVSMFGFCANGCI